MARFTRERSFERREPRRSSRESGGFSERRTERPGRFEERGERSSGRERFSGGFSDRSARGRFDNSRHKVICDKCGETCEVPFKPTSGKPIYCSDCFRKKDSNSPESRKPEAPRNGDELEEINRKLDKIMKALKIN